MNKKHVALVFLIFSRVTTGYSVLLSNCSGPGGDAPCVGVSKEKP
jgi:hypothetical protein